MIEILFRKLQQHLNQLPMGFPSTKSGVEIRLLKKMFDEEEAAIALALTPEAQTAEDVAEKLGSDPKATADGLERMATKGLVLRTREGQRVYYALVPYIVGMYEFQLARLDEEYIDLHHQYGAEAMGREVMGSETPYHRIISVERNIPTDLVALPYEKISELIDQAGKICLSDCICRTKQNMIGQGCGHSIETCLWLSPIAEYFIENGWPGRLISKEDAFEILEKCEEEGLLHATQNAASGVWYICNCCSCCCGMMQALKAPNMLSHVSRPFYHAQVNEDLCSGCEVCLDRCQFEAISMVDDVATVNVDQCLGCGLCVSTCSTEALSLARRREDHIVSPPPDLDSMMNIIGDEKGGRFKINT